MVGGGQEEAYTEAGRGTIGRVRAALVIGLAMMGQAAYGQIKVACIGNSITQGYRPNGNPSYVDTLGILLGSGFTVENDGVSGTTLIRVGDYPYWVHGKLAQVFHFRPDVITIKLGTNDAKHDPAKVDNWKYGSQYEPAYNSLIDTLYSTLGYKPRIFLVFPIAAFAGNGLGVSDTTYTKEMIPAIKRVAARYGLPTIDAHTPFIGHPGWVTDGIHPDFEGADTLGSIIYRSLTTTAMLAFPSALDFTVIQGAGTTVAAKTVTLSNIAVTGSLQSATAVPKSPWLKTTVNSGNLNAQVITNSIVAGSIPSQPGIYRDTVTVTAANASPTTLAYVVTLAVTADTWSHSKAVATINTTPAGSDIASPLIGFPYVVRLNAANFDFSQAMKSGDDIGFTREGGTTPLPFQIESWDSAGANAAVWVKVDSIFPNNATQAIRMHWGRKGSRGASSGNGVFPAANGFAGVWHLNRGSEDATVNAFDGMDNYTGDAPARVANGRSFSGAGSFITIPVPFSALPSAITYSAWIKANSLKPNGHTILYTGTKGEAWLSHEADSMVFSVKFPVAGWVGVKTGPVLETGKWFHVAGVWRKGMDIALYVNGAKAVTVAAPNEDLNNPPGFYSPSIGAYNAGYGFLFDGVIDEAGISSTARSADWIKLSYYNQWPIVPAGTVIPDAKAGRDPGAFGLSGFASGRIYFSVPSARDFRTVVFTVYSLQGKAVWSASLSAGSLVPGRQSIPVGVNGEMARSPSGAYLIEMKVVDQESKVRFRKRVGSTLM